MSVISKSHPDIRLYSTASKSIYKVLPSDIDEDEWAEIANYQRDKELERKRKELEANFKRKLEVKAVLDAQLRER